VYEHSALDPALVHLRDRRTAEFSPSLTSELPAGATLLLDVNGLAQAAPRILAAGSVAGFAGAVAPLLSRLGRALAAEGVDVHGALSLFSGETAVAVTPGSSASGGSPALVIVTRTRDESRARSPLAALELPLAQLFPAPASGPGVAPEFYDRTVAGITAHQLSLTPGLNLDYAVFDGLVVVSTSLDGIAGVALHEHALPADPAYRLALAGSPAHVSSLLFLDFSQLLSLGEQTGLISGTRYRLLRPDLEKVRAVGLVSTGGESDSTAELTLQIK
jgi:hypothetical protein